MPSWDGVTEFVAVAETESFTAAAKRLDSSVANISRQIQALENRLATKLFHRTTRKVSATEEGRVFYHHCRQLLDGLDDAERAISNLQTKPTGKLKITAPLSYGEKFVAPLVNDFAIEYPDLDIEMLLSNQQFDLIENGFDLAIRLGVLEDSTLVARKLADRTQYVCASPHYLAQYGQPHTLSELNSHNCLLGTLDYWRFEEAGKQNNLKVTGNLRYNSGPALRDAALKGLGLVQLPDYYVGELIAAGELVPVLNKQCQSMEGIWAVYPSNRHLSTKVRMLINCLAQGLTPDNA
jgi:DNA-binding transcriptional LysR family regulator